MDSIRFYSFNWNIFFNMIYVCNKSQNTRFQVTENHLKEVKGKETVPTQPQSRGNVVTGSRAPLKVSSVQYLILFNRKIDCGICI
jgi:hypothetical protein